MNKEKTDENYIVRNMESGFLEIHINSKDAYLELSTRNRELLKNKFRWSRKAPGSNAGHKESWACKSMSGPVQRFFGQSIEIKKVTCPI